jgi:hypothetical protein
MVTDASIFACRCRGGVLKGVTVRTVGCERRRGSLERSHPDCRKPSLRFYGGGRSVCTLMQYQGCNGFPGQAPDRQRRWRRFLRFTVSPDSETRIAAAACTSVGARYRFTWPGRGKGRPVVPVTGGGTWTQVRAPAGPQSPNFVNEPDQRQLQEHPSQLRCG